MTELDHTISALSDPTRRRIVNMLAERTLSAGEIGAAFEISAPALSRHLRILRRSGLVEDERSNQDNRLRMYKLRITPLKQLLLWLEEVDASPRDQAKALTQPKHRGSSDMTKEVR